jgi:hypothetical protein
MSEKTPETWSALTWIAVIALALLGGAVQYWRKLQAIPSRAFRLAELAGEMATSAFAGVITALLCQYAGFSLYLTAALCGIAGHMGSRALMHLERVFTARLPGDPPGA